MLQNQLVYIGGPKLGPIKDRLLIPQLKRVKASKQDITDIMDDDDKGIRNDHRFRKRELTNLWGQKCYAAPPPSKGRLVENREFRNRSGNGMANKVKYTDVLDRMFAA